VATSSVIETIVFPKRLSESLHAEELQQDAAQRINKSSLSIGDAELFINGGEFTWHGGRRTMTSQCWPGYQFDSAYG